MLLADDDVVLLLGAVALPLLVLVPGGSIGLGAVLGELFSSCANPIVVETTKQIPKQLRANKVGKNFIVAILFGSGTSGQVL